MRKLICRLPMLHPGMHALSPEMAIKDLKGRDHGHVVIDSPVAEPISFRAVGRESPYLQRVIAGKLTDETVRCYDREWASAFLETCFRIKTGILDWYWGRLRWVVRPRIYLLGIPEHANVGDSAIVKAMCRFLASRFPNTECLPYTGWQTCEWLPRFQKEIRPWDVICLPGGGNFGNQYKPEEKLFRTVIAGFPNNPIIVFPQTIYFTQDAAGASSFAELAKLCCRHHKLFFFARECRSVDLYGASLGIGNRLELVPDITFDLDEYYELPREDVFFCLRSDCEGIEGPDDVGELQTLVKEAFGDIPIRKGDMIADVLITYQNRELVLNSKFGEFARAKLVVTDRLHGMIFAYLTGTPCLVLPNYNHKVVSVFEGFLSDVPYIRFARNKDERGPLLNVLARLSNCRWRPDKRFDYSKLERRLRNYLP